MDTFTDTDVYNLPETTFMAGTYKELNFYLKTTSGSQINLTSASTCWTLAPLNQPDYIAVYKEGTGYSDRFKIILLSSDTKDLTGKYIQTAMLIKTSGSAGHDYRVARGIVNLIPAVYDRGG